MVWPYGDLEPGTLFIDDCAAAGLGPLWQLTGTAGHTHPRVATDGNEYVVVWEDGAGNSYRLRTG